MLDKQSEIRKFAEGKGFKEAQQIETQAKQAVNQRALDEVFTAFLNKEYQDKQIGDLEEEAQIDPLAFIEAEEAKEGEDDEYYDYGELSDGEMPAAPSNFGLSTADKLEMKQEQDKEMINEAIDEFIQDKKSWFRNLHRKHGEDYEMTSKEKGNEFLEGTAKFIGKDLIPIMGDMEQEQADKLIKERTLQINERFEEEAEKRAGSEYESSEEEEDHEEKWDAETILTTYTNTDNHPGVIKFVPKVKVNSKAKIELHSQFKVPIDGLNGLIPIAEEVRKKKKQKVNRTEAFESDSESEQSEGEGAESEDKEIAEEDGKEINPRKAAKKALKVERREKRKQKKELKLAFKNQIGKVQKQQTVKTAGEIRPGVSVRKIE